MTQVDYRTLDGTARAGIKYKATSGTLIFGKNKVFNQSITIPIIDDDEFAPDT